MISKKLQDALNVQITAELWAANLYLSMSFHLAKLGYTGAASWMKKQSQEEMGHVYKIADYLIEREGTAEVNKVDVVPTDWGTPLSLFEAAFEHEKRVSKMIDKLMTLAEDEKDYATQDFLSWFVNEQVEEESSARAIVQQMKLAGEPGWFYIDRELAKR